MKYIRILVLAAVMAFSFTSIYSESKAAGTNYEQGNIQADTLVEATRIFLELLSDPSSKDCADMYALLAAAYNNINRENPDSVSLIVLSDIAYYCGYYDYTVGKYEKSRDFYIDVLDLERMRGDTTGRKFYIALSQIGLTYFNVQRYSESIRPLQESIQIREKVLGKGSSELIRPLVNLSASYVEISALDEAESTAQLGIDLIMKTGNYQNQLCTLYYILGRLYKEKGDYNTTKTYLSKASASFFEYQGDPDLLLLIYNFNAVIAGMFNDTITTLDSYSKAIEYIRSSSYKGSQGTSVYSNFGFYLALIGRLDEAESMFLEAIDYSEKNFGPYSNSNIQELENYADFLVDNRNNYKHAEVIYSDLFGRIESVNDIRVMTSVCRGYAEVKSHFKDFESALDLYYIVDQRQDEMSPFNRAYYLQGRGEVFLNYYEHSDSLSLLLKALNDFDHAIYIIDSSKVDLGGEESRLDITGKFDFFTDKAIKSAFLLYNSTSDNNYLAKAFAYSEKSKASTLLTATRESRAMKFHIPDSLLFTEKMLSGKIKEFEAMIHQERGKAVVSNASLNALESDRLDAYIEREELIKKFENEYPGYYRLKHNTLVAQPEDIEKNIGRQMNFLEYYTSDSTIYIFVINRNGFFLSSMEIDSCYNRTIKQFRNDLVKPVFENGARDQFSRIVKNAYFLYNILIKPIEDQLVSDKLIIASDDLLSYIPFESLVSDTTGLNEINYRDLSFLFRKYNIEYTYSATLLLENPGKGRSISNKALVFAPWYRGDISSDSIMISRQTERQELKDIHGAKEEAIYISELLGGDLYVDSDASEINFIRKCRTPRIIHLAMHTLINDREPMLSKMVFSHEQRFHREWHT